MKTDRRNFFTLAGAGSLAITPENRQLHLVNAKSVGIGPNSLIDSVLIHGASSPHLPYRICPGSPLPFDIYNRAVIIDTSITNVAVAGSDLSRLADLRRMSPRLALDNRGSLGFNEWGANYTPPSVGVMADIVQPMLELLIAENELDYQALISQHWRAPYGRSVFVDGVTAAAYVAKFAIPCYGRRVIDMFAQAGSAATDIRLRIFHDPQTAGEIVQTFAATAIGAEVTVMLTDSRITWAQWEAKGSAATSDSCWFGGEVADR